MQSVIFSFNELSKQWQPPDAGGAAARALAALHKGRVVAPAEHVS